MVHSDGKTDRQVMISYVSRLPSDELIDNVCKKDNYCIFPSDLNCFGVRPVAFLNDEQK